MSSDIEKTYQTLNRTLSFIIPVLLAGIAGLWVYKERACAGKAPAKRSQANNQRNDQPAPFAPPPGYFEHLNKDLEKQWGRDAVNNWAKFNAEDVIEANRRAARDMMAHPIAPPRLPR